MPYLFLILSCLACLVSGFLLNNAATTTVINEQGVVSLPAKSIRLTMFILSAFLFTVSIALSVAAYTITLHG